MVNLEEIFTITKIKGDVNEFKFTENGQEITFESLIETMEKYLDIDLTKKEREAISDVLQWALEELDYVEKDEINKAITMCNREFIGYAEQMYVCYVLESYVTDYILEEEIEKEFSKEIADVYKRMNKENELDEIFKEESEKLYDEYMSKMKILTEEYKINKMAEQIKGVK